jgi:hypothetical protein
VAEAVVAENLTKSYGKQRGVIELRARRQSSWAVGRLKPLPSHSVASLPSRPPGRVERPLRGRPNDTRLMGGWEHVDPSIGQATML